MSEAATVYFVSTARSDAVTYTEVHEAAYKLLRRGHRPSVRTVRQILGRGSPNTISEHLQKFWMQLVPPAGHAQAALGVYSTPPEVLDYTQRIWELMTAEAQRLATIQLTEDQRASNQKQVELLARLQVSSLREQALQQDYAQTTARNRDLEVHLARLRTEQEEALGTIQALRDHSARLASTCEDLTRDLANEQTAHAALRREVRTTFKLQQTSTKKHVKKKAVSRRNSATTRKRARKK